MHTPQRAAYSQMVFQISTTRSRLEYVRGVFSAREPDSSVGGVSVGYCPDDGHMEEEVQLKVQVEEGRIGEKHGREQGEEQRENRQSSRTYG